jgi:glycosyltransferase involved in cell wall biosynthesis
MSGPPKTILIRGWRLLPHSYAVVNQFQCLELLRRPDITLYFEDAPFHSPRWSTITGLWPAAQEAAITQIPPPPADLVPDCELRVAFPYDLNRPPRGRRLCVFGTAEFYGVPNRSITGGVRLADAHARAADAIIVTPSTWSREGFLRSGAAPSRVEVIPHGVDPQLFHPPTPSERAVARVAFRAADDEFVFLFCGAMTGNKRIDLLLRAFAQVLREYPRARLFLKGLDALYSSQQLVDRCISRLPPADAYRILPRLTYNGDSLTFPVLSQLHHMSDCYVTPYAAEGFNLPALEAAACGVPVVCTAGGPTDDFVTSDFARRIDSQLVNASTPDVLEGRALEPSLDSLVRHMIAVIEQREFRERAAVAGPAHVSAHFTWAKVVDRLLGVLLP